MLRFRRLGSSTLYLGESTDPAAPADNHGQILYILPSQTPLPASSMTLEQAWSFQHASLGAGYFLFFQSGPPLSTGNQGEVDAFAGRIHDLLPRVVRNQHASLGWVMGQAGNPDSIRLQTLNFVRDAGGAIQTQNIPQAIRFQQHELMILPATPFELASNESGFVLLNTDFMAPPGADPRADQPTNKRIYMRGAAAYNIDKVGDTVFVPLWGGGRGSLQFDLNEIAAADIDAGVMDVAMYYVVPEASLERDQSLRYPVLNLANPGGSAGPTTLMNLKARLYPADHGASIFDFGNDNQAQGPVLQSFFATYHGYPVHLVPLAGAGLVFNHVPNPGVYPSRSAEVATHYGLTPVGNFELLVDNPADEMEWLRGGSSGSEFVSFQPRKNGNHGDVIAFFPNQNGYAPDFSNLVDINPTRHLQQSDSGLLTDKFKTSWVSVGYHPLAGPNGHRNQYYAQPDDNVLHTSVNSNLYLNPFEVAAADLPLLSHMPSDGEWASFPLTPLNGVMAPDERISPPIGMDKYVIFEKEIMSPTRKERITSAKFTSIATYNGRSLFQTTPSVQAVTPQGMLVDVEGNDWKSLTLAYDGLETLKFDDITDEFQDALQSNRLFLVASKDESLAADANYTQDKVEITGWPFKIEVGKNPHGVTPPSDGIHRLNNVMIFKFVDETFEDLVADTRVWANPGFFNDDLADVQTWLQEYIEDAKAKAEDPETEGLYGPLVNNVLMNANWTGVLALNVTVPVNEMPCEVQGLLGGIRKLAEFKAHHVGFEISKVNDQGTDIEKSSIFALIDYEDGDPATGGTDYEFLVKTLKVRFANTEIADFASAISITMKKAFDETIKDPITNVGKVTIDTLELEGSYQVFNGVPTYTFELIAVNNPFEFAGTTDRLSLIKEMTVTKVQFATETCVDLDSDPSARIAAKFSYWGYLTFRSNAAFDFFSFDKLVFSGLTLKMNFGFNADGTPEPPAIPPVFEFDPSGLNFSVSVSKPRKDSLLANFPLKVNSFHYAPSGLDVSHLGYLEIPNFVPGWGATEAGFKPRYGLSFTIDIGPLASQSAKKKPRGAIEIIAAWYTVDEGSGVIFGLKLGAGSDGSKEIGIEGVLTLAVDNFGFLKIPENPFVDPVDPTNNQDYIYAFFIKSAFLKIVNTQIPPGGDFSLMLFIPYNGESGSVNMSNLGWFVAYNRDGGSSTGGGAPAPVDVEIKDLVISPSSTIGEGTNASIKVQVKNVSSANLPLEVTVKVVVTATGDNTARPLPPTPPSRKITVNPMQTTGADDLVFTWPGKLPGTYEAVATATVPGDLTPGNNVSDPAPIEVSASGGKKEKRSIVKLDYLGIGHRVELATVDQEFRLLNTVESVIDVMRNGLLPEQSGPALVEQLQKIYKPDNGILIGADVTLFEVVRIAFIFAQTNEVYGALIGFVDKAPAKLKGFQFQILYKKITDDIGVYQMVLKLPDFIRQFELGAASITLPLIGIDIYTNGNFKLDFGFPYNADFTRSFSIQMMAGPIPIIGFAGFYFAYLSGATSTVVPVFKTDSLAKWDPVLEFGIGLSLGIGKHIEKGPLRAGVSISIQVILEGALAWYQHPDLPASTLGNPPDWYRVKGMAGLAAQLYGIVDFGIIKVGIEVNASANFTFIFESFKDIQMGVNLSVSVRVTVVLGSFKIFGKTIRIEISFSFSATFSFAFTVANPMGTTPPWANELSNPTPPAFARPLSSLQQVSAGPIVWDALDVHGGTKKDLHLTFAPQITIAMDGTEQRAHAVAGLTIGAGDGSDFNTLLRSVMSWAVKLHTSSASLDLADLEELDARLHIPRTLATSEGNSAKPLNYTQIRDFLIANFEPLFVAPVAIVADADPEPAAAQATVFPMLPELTLEVTRGPGDSISIDFAHHNPRNEQYQLDVADYFDELLVDVEYKSGIFQETSSLLSHDEDTEVSMATIVVQDYFAFLIKSGVDRAIEYVRVDPDGGSIDLDDLLDALEDGGDFTTVSRMAARFFFHGLRIPPSFPENTDNVTLSASALPLYELTGQQVPILLVHEERDGDDVTQDAEPWSIEIHTGSTSLINLGSAPVRLTIPAGDDPSNSRANVGILETLTPAIGGDITVDQLESLVSSPRQFSFKNPTHFEVPAEAKAGTLYPLSDVLLDRLTSRGSLDVTLHNEGTDEEGNAASGVGDSAKWSLRVNFTAKRVQRSIDGTGALLNNTYLIAGTTEGARNLIGRVLEDTSHAISGMRLYYEIEGKTDALVGESLGGSSEVVLMKTNLSTVSAPQSDTTLLSHDSEGVDYSAEMDTTHARDFLRLIWEASITNAPGYYLYYHNGAGSGETGLPEDIFGGGANQANLTLVVTFDKLNDACNTLLIDSGSFVEGDFFATAEGEYAWHPAIAPGAVAFELTRPNPQHEEFDNPKGAIALEPLFNLLSYYVVEDAAGNFAESIKGLPVGPTGDDPDPSAAEPTHWTYRQGIKVAPFALQNLGVPDVRPNLYAGMGNQITLGFEFLDIFGNVMPLSAGDAVPTKDLDVYYADPIKGVGQWPSLTSGYMFQASDGQLIVTLHFSASDYKPAVDDPVESLDAKARRVASALETYLQIKEQLDGPHVTALLTTTVAPAKDVNVLADLRGFVGDIIEFLGAPETEPAPTDKPLSMTITGTDRSAQTDNTFAVTVHVTIERTSGVDPMAVEDGGNGALRLPEVARSITSVAPESTSGMVPESDSEQPMALTAFAEAFESAFTDFKVATGLGEDGPQTIWAIRMPSNGITVSIPNSPVYFAPAPLSNVLEQRDSVLVRLDGPDGEVTKESFANVDMDVWGREFLEAVDRFLSADLAVTARQVNPGDYLKVIKGKEALAEGIAAGVTNVLTHSLSQDDFEKYVAAAREAYEQSLLTRLSTAYEIETAVVYPATTTNSDTTDTIPPRLYGQVTGSLVSSADEETSPGFTFSTAKVELDNSTGPKFTYLFNAERAEEHASAHVNVHYNVTHVEHDIQEAVDGYQASSWLTLLLPDEPINVGPADIPIALREYPVPPTLIGQNALPADPEGEITVQNATLWQYLYTYQQQAVAQDSIFANIKFNVGPEILANLLQDEDPDLFDWLARFYREYPLFQADVDLLVKGQSELAASGETTKASDAVAWFADLVEGIAATWKPWVENAAATRNLLQALEEYEWEFEIIERHDPGQGRIEIVRTANGEPDARFPAVEVLLEDGETRSVIDVPPGSVNVASYVYPWTAESLPETLERTFIFADLDVLSTENAWGGIHLQRNLNLSSSAVSPPTTNPRFVYQTPQVRFVNKVTPLIDNKQAIDISRGQTTSLAGHLAALLNELFESAVTESNPRERLVKIGVRYAYDVRGQGGPAIGPGQADEFQAYLPVTQRMPFEITPNDMGGFISDLTGAINAWKQAVDPIEARGFYEFDVSVFAALSATDLPVLRLRRLWLGLDRIG